MPSPLSATVARVGRALLAADLTDGQLVGRFVRSRDGDAFAALVRRHGPMVLAVCRRVAGDVHLADDAFQAAFLVLARRAADVVPREAVRSWLYGVAVRTAREARSMSARRRSREVPVAVVPDRAAYVEPPADSDALRTLDEEIARLPDHLRAAVVLCELDGLSRKDAAQRLGVPEGTLSSRLAKARKLLAGRLRGQGVAAVSLSVLLERSVSAAGLPVELADAAIGLVDSGLIPASVADLSRGVFRTMLLKKLKVASVGVMLFLTGTASVCTWGRSAGAGEGETPAEPTRRVVRRAPVPKVPREGVILVTAYAEGHPAELFKPDGTPIREPKVGMATAPWKPRISPDGKRVLVFHLGPIPPNTGPWTPNQLHVFDLDSEDGSGEAIVSDLRYSSAVWSADSTKLYGSSIDQEKVNDRPKQGDVIPLVSWVYDLTAKTKTPLAVPAGHGVVDVSPDGKTLLTAKYTRGGGFPAKTYLVPLATLKPELLTDKPFGGMRFSPSGKRVIGGRPRDRGNGLPAAQDLYVITLADRSEVRVKLPEEVSTVVTACWSPDGKRIAYHWQEEIPQPPNTPIPVGPGKWSASRVTVADPDGSNAKTIIRREYNQSITGIDWR